MVATNGWRELESTIYLRKVLLLQIIEGYNFAVLMDNLSSNYNLHEAQVVLV